MIKKYIMIFLLWGISLSTPIWAQNTGNIPVPIFTNAGVRAEITYVSGTGLYTYNYSITNPATNTGEIWSIYIDARQPSYGQALSSDGLTIPHGFITNSFDESISSFKSGIASMVPVGIGVPSGWGGGLGVRGVAGFSSNDLSYNILPGDTKDGFQLISRGLPAIRNIEIQPWWIMAVNEEATDEDANIGRATIKSLKYTTKTIGPTAPPRDFNAREFLDIINVYIDESVTLGWLVDSTLATTLKAKLDTARSLIETDDTSSAKVVLGEMMDLINNATSSQLSSEARGLLFYNIQYLKNTMNDTYIPPVKTISVTPEETTLSLGTTYTLTITSKIDGEPLGNCQVTAQVVSGPNEGIVLEGPSSTDSNGQAVFTYTSRKVGMDTVLAQAIEIYSVAPSSKGIMLAMNDINGTVSDIAPRLGIMLASSDSTVGYESMEAEAKVTWIGGPDLTIPLFIPPVIKTQGGNTIYVTEITKNNENVATAAAGSSITRYYISEDEVIDPETDISIGAREISPLEPGESSESVEFELLIPDDLPSGTYYCGACADADNSVAELDEENNCENNELAIVAILKICGDFNDDGKVDAADAKIIRGAFGSSIGQVKYVEEADYDGDQNIDASDYQLWYNCYKAYINK